jgi:amidophosphoribosyltransferase
MSMDGGATSNREGCGIAGIAFTQGEVAYPLFYALYALQHRGQESAGIAVSSGVDEGAGAAFGDRKQITVIKDMGLVSEVFTPQRLAALKGSVGIGHVRYPTSGPPKVENAEPLLVEYRNGELAIAHNGNLVNTAALRHALEKEGRIFHSDTDTEVLAQLLAKELLRHPPLEALSKVMKCVVGSYSLVLLLNDTLLAVRDPWSIKPLCLGRLRVENGGMGDGYVIASESPAIELLGGEFIRDLGPGEVLVITPSRHLSSAAPAPHPELTVASHQLVRAAQTAHCVFEYIYFARPDSVIDGQLVYDVRLKIGERLAEEHPVDADIVSPVPDSGITFAIGYAKRSGIDYAESLIKNRYVGRTFIMPEQRSRDIAVRLKLNVVRANVEGKRIVLVDDSIVRGTTSRRIVEYLKQQGAKEVHVRIGSPPIIAPCYLGIDTPTREELLASTRSLEGVRSYLKADSIGYVSLEGLIESVGIEGQHLCLGCLTSNYPVEIPGEQCRSRQVDLARF